MAEWKEDEVSRYEPELGQAVFGQPWQQFEVKGALASALDALANGWYVLMGDEDGNPFTNSGATFDSEKVSVHAYSWGDDEQPWNLRWKDVRISWYKHCGRGATVNRKVSDKEARDLFLDVIRAAVEEKRKENPTKD